MPRPRKPSTLGEEREAMLYRIVACADACGKKISEMSREEQFAILQEVLFANMMDERAAASTAAVKEFLELLERKFSAPDAQPGIDRAAAVMERLAGGKAVG